MSHAPPDEPRVAPADFRRADEDALARARPLVRAACVDREELSLGVAQADDVPCAVQARAWGITVGRRSSGGTAVLVAPGDWAWSLVLPRDDPRVGRDYARAYDRFGAGVVEALRAAGVASAWEPPRGLSSSLCLLGERGSVLVAGGKVVGGCAQHVTARALLHHGVVARSVDRPRVASLFDIPRETLRQHLGSMEECGGAGLTASTLAAHLGAGLGVPIDRS